MRRWSHFLSYRCEALSVLNCPKCSITFLCTYWCMCVCLTMSWHPKDWITDCFCINLFNANHLGNLEYLFTVSVKNSSLDVTIISWYPLLKLLCYIVIKPWIFSPTLWSVMFHLICGLWDKEKLLYFFFLVIHINKHLSNLVAAILSWKSFFMVYYNSKLMPGEKIKTKQGLFRGVRTVLHWEMFTLFGNLTCSGNVRNGGDQRQKIMKGKKAGNTRNCINWVKNVYMHDLSE